ncbi:MAG: hypothetical protein Q4B22_06930 [Eubacteriales bacterium]|nr:hypothetical protein [Eubacteriales bacterium]
MYKLENKNTTVSVSAYGAMTTVCFHTEKGDVSPLFQRDWGAIEDIFMRNLKGEFFASPFGAFPENYENLPENWRKNRIVREGKAEYAHGYGAHHIWNLCSQKSEQIVLEIQYPGAPIEKVQRTITITPKGFRMQVEDRIFIGKDGEITSGIHPMFRLSETPGKTKITMPSCERICTYPMDLDESSSFKPDIWVEDLHAVPLKAAGKRIDAACLPFEQHSEDLLLLCNVTDPSFTIENTEEDYKVRMTWDTEELKHCVLWFSNRGRTFAPWNGTNVCLGVEPVTSAFDFGIELSGRNNPLNEAGYRTIREEKKGEILSLKHTIELL